MAVDLQPPELPDDGEEGKEEHQFVREGKRQNRVLRELSARIARRLQEMVAPSVATIATRADAERATWSAAERDEIEQFLAGRQRNAAAAMLLRHAAVLRTEAEAPRRAGDRQRLLDALEAATRAVYVQQRVPGSKWALDSGCGVEIEGQKESMQIACGMGFTPELGRRMLYFFEQS